MQGVLYHICPSLRTGQILAAFSPIKKHISPYAHTLGWEVKSMTTCSCRYNASCILFAVITSLIVGIIASFLQITAAITITPAFLWTLFGVVLGLFAVLLFSSAQLSRTGSGCDRCAILNIALAGILGTVLFSVILLIAGIVATSIISAIFVGLLLFSFALTLTSLACYIRCTLNCGD